MSAAINYAECAGMAIAMARSPGLPKKNVSWLAGQRRRNVAAAGANWVHKWVQHHGPNYLTIIETRSLRLPKNHEVFATPTSK